MNTASTRPNPPGAFTSTPVNEHTAGQYFRIAKRLYHDSERRRSSDPELLAPITNLDVVSDLLETAPGLRPNTWRMYRAALRHHFQELLTTLPEERHASVRVALDRLENYRWTGPRGKPERTSSARRRSFTEDDLALLVRFLNNRRASPLGWALRTAHWLLAGLATGLRPVEWDQGRLVGERILVINAKRRGGEASAAHAAELTELLALDPELRALEASVEGWPSWLRVVPVDPEDLMWVKAHLASLAELKQKGIPFTKIYEHSRIALRRACDELWGGSRRISLYTARGQFAANNKAIMPLKDVSKLMGHKSSKTTQRNYGKRRSAHQSFRPDESQALDAREALKDAGQSQAGLEFEAPSSADSGEARTGRFAALVRFAPES